MGWKQVRLGLLEDATRERPDWVHPRVPAAPLRESRGWESAGVEGGCMEAALRLHGSRVEAGKTILGAPLGCQCEAICLTAVRGTLETSQPMS